MAAELDNLVAQMAARADLDRPNRDDRGRFFFVFDGEHEIMLFQSGSTIYIEARVSPLPAERDNALDLLERCLKSQLARFKNKHEVLSIDPEDGQLALFRELPARTLSVADFEQVLGDFVNGLEFWSNQASGNLRGGPSPAAMSMLRR